MLIFVLIVHVLTYTGSNPCNVTAQLGGCSHICLLAPVEFYPQGFSCHCPPGLELLADQKTCNPCMVNCSKAKCGAEEFTCKETGRCISRTLVCDDTDDCADNSDEFEEHCDKSHLCKADEFRCNTTGECIPKRWVCDGADDCGDTSDELNCTVPVCKEGQFLCNNSKSCIPVKWKCDGDKDCLDNSDEADCPTASRKCHSREFQCKDGSCIHGSWVCDGDPDCQDKSDELNCTTPSPSPSPSECDGNKCGEL